MSKPSVLIVGAGAMGMVTGYHLQLGGTDITSLVRPGRVEAFHPPKQLYCYDDGTLKTYANYRVIDNVADIGHAPDFVLSTLDGATARTLESTALLGALGRAMASSPTVFIMGGVGVGLREHVLQATGLPAHRLLNASLSMLAHQVSAGLPVLPPTDAAKLAQASVAYRHLGKQAAMVIDATYAEPAKAFAALYSRSGVSKAAVIPKTLLSIMTNAAFPMLAASEIAGWPTVDGLVTQHRALWHLCCQAQGEVTRLKQHGWLGRGVAMIMGDGLSARIQRKVEQDAKPLDYQAFNRFHHGGKVALQDLQVMQNCMALGRQQGQPMAALGELLDRLAAYRALQPAGH